MTPKITSLANPDAVLQQGLRLHQQGQLDQAAEMYRHVLAKQPRHSQALYLLGTLALQGRQFELAEQLLGQAIQANAKHLPSLINLAMALSQQDRDADALTRIEQALAVNENSSAAQSTRVGILVKLNRSGEAVEAVDRLAEHGHQTPELCLNKGLALLEMGQLSAAESCFDTAIAMAPGYLSAHHHKILCYVAQEDFSTALILADRLIATASKYAEAHADRGLALLGLRDYEAAVVALERACALAATDQRIAYLATSLALCGQTQKALACVARGLQINPGSVALWSAEAQVHMALGDYASAVQGFDKYLNAKGEVSKVLLLKAFALMQLKRYEEAKAVIERCNQRDRDRNLAVLLYAKLMTADWSGLDVYRERLANLVDSDDHDCNPFATLGLLNDGAAQRRVASTYSVSHRLSGSTWVPAPAPVTRLRIGYFSADFHQHATSQLMVEMLECHEHARFELFGFSYGPVREDPMTERVAAAFDHFTYVKDWSDQEIAAKARQCQLDIAVDLKGFTQDARPRILRAGCAPIQVSFLGFPGTLAMDCIDYIIADDTIAPTEHEQHFSEKIVRMPHSYQCNDSHRPIDTRRFSRAELGLPDTGFVFCCFNNNYKIVPEVFERWMRVLLATPDSVLWLYEGNASCATNLRAHAQAAGVEPDRLVFAPPLPLAEHLARIQAADLFLDTLPCNAHTTASDALWAGVPLLTCLGQAFHGRVAASLLRALSMDELVTHDLDAYEAEAIALAREPERLQGLRQRLTECRETAPLFDGRRFARNIEQAYETMVQRQRSGLPPESFSVIEATSTATP
ncbi:tetratricopeptide repeat protein [Ottowia sp. GY511]|uniref:protein O-GlcNAc transferase n=1 Tax=Ottowia flava TaxID=2675430 RepID=A0ABW4KUP5_9BURK|nr:tetratricopeptide repeat protein [Ottowia sp. GY511]TXK26609.1 tetratricopeptide repeat protein [Ottowia sp. GY511]